MSLFNCSIEFEYVDNTVEYTYSRSEMALSWMQICMASSNIPPSSTSHLHSGQVVRPLSVAAMPGSIELNQIEA